jgi:glyoxylase-like metal-dependent hydrolase (beta-lactamase superfamily II)
VEEISPAELARLLDAGEPMQVLDVRAPAALAGGAIDLAAPGMFFNRPGSRIVGQRTFGGDFPRPDLPVAVVCHHGNDSRVVAHYLKGLGYRATSLSGGMSAWAGVVLPRELAAPSGFERLIQLDRVGKGALGYALVSDGEALLVDPPRNASAYLAAVEAAAARVIAVADTHVHADYVSGAPALARALGVPYLLHPADAVSPYDGRPARFEFEPLSEGGTIRVGRGQVRVQHTPGHTEGSVTCLVGDDIALTGDFLFVNSVGRPDLGGRTDEWTPVLWASLQRAKREWPGGLRILPAHYSAAEERGADRTVGRRLADLPAGNEALRISDAAAFVAWVKQRTGDIPEAYRIIKGLNLGLLAVSAEEIGYLEGGRSACALG